MHHFPFLLGPASHSLCLRGFCLGVMVALSGACSQSSSRQALTDGSTSKSSISSKSGETGTIVVVADVSVDSVDNVDTGVLLTSDGAPQRCDEAGLNCKCIAIANIGAVGSSGTTNAFDTWLNTKSNARVDNYPTDVTIDAAFLANYDELVFQDISTWTITTEEIDAITTWVKAGGGLMSMQGYQGTTAEITNINSILAPLGFAYSSNTSPSGILWQAVSNWNESSPISKEMISYKVNVHNGRPVVDNSGTGTLVIAATSGSDTYNLGYTETVGKGHVFPWCDEWVTYTSEWDDETGLMRVEQFWYNTITYLTPTDVCKVVINDSHIIVVN